MENIIEKFNLPKYLKGKSFAEASKLLEKKFDGRTDNDSLETKKELMGRLRQAQDYVKELQEFKNKPEVSVQPEMPEQNQAFLGGAMEAIGGAQGAGNALSSIMSMVDGFTGKPGVDTSGATSAEYTSEAGQAANAALSGAQAGMNFGPIGAGVGALGGGASGLVKGKKMNEAAEEANRNNTYANASAFNNMFKKGGILSNLTDPSTGGKGKGKKKLNEKQVQEVRDASGIAFTEEGANQLFTTNDPSTSPSQPDLDLGKYKGRQFFDITNQGTDYIVNPTKNNPQNAQGYKEQMNYLRKLNPNAKFSNDGYKQFQNRMNDGGPLTGGKPRLFNAEQLTQMENAIRKSQANPLIDTDAIDDAFNNAGISDNASLYGADPISPVTGSNSSQNVSGSQNTNSSQSLVDTGNWLERALGKVGDGVGTASRYAPSFMNAIQAATLKKPDQEGLERTNRRYNRNYQDEEAITNKVGDSVAANREAILDSAVGSGAAARANLIANSLVGTKALSDAFFNMQNANNQENRFAQQFDAQADNLNIQQANRENEINAQNKGNYETQKSKLLAALGNDVGNIGREELFKKYPELMGALYNWKGKFTGGTEANS